MMDQAEEEPVSSYGGRRTPFNEANLQLVRSASETCIEEAVRRLRCHQYESEEPAWPLDWRRTIDEMAIAQHRDDVPARPAVSHDLACASAPRLQRSHSDQSPSPQHRGPPVAPAPSVPLPPSPARGRAWHQQPAEEWVDMRRQSDASVLDSINSSPRFSFRHSFASSVSTDLTTPSSRPASLVSPAGSPVVAHGAPATKLASLRQLRPTVPPAWAVTVEGGTDATAWYDESSSTDEAVYNLAPAVAAHPFAISSPVRPRKSSKRYAKGRKRPQEGDVVIQIPGRTSSSSTELNTERNRASGASGTSTPKATPVPVASAAASSPPSSYAGGPRSSPPLPAALPMSYLASAPDPLASSVGDVQRPTRPRSLSSSSKKQYESNLTVLEEQPEPTPSLQSEEADLPSPTGTSGQGLSLNPAEPILAALLDRRDSADMPGRLPRSGRSSPEPDESADREVDRTPDAPRTGVPQSTSWGNGLYLSGFSDSIRRLASWGWGTPPGGAAAASTGRSIENHRTPSPESPRTSMSTMESAVETDEVPTPEDDPIDTRSTASKTPTISRLSPHSSGRQTPVAITSTEYGDIMGPLPEGFEEEFAAAMRELKQQEDAGSDKASFHSAIASVDGDGNVRTVTASAPNTASTGTVTPPRIQTNLQKPVKRAPSVISTTPSTSSSGSMKKKFFSRLGRNNRPAGPPIVDEPEQEEIAYRDYGTGRQRSPSLLTSTSSPASARTRQPSIASSLDTASSGETGEGHHEPLSASAQPLKPSIKGNARNSTSANNMRRPSRTSNVFSVRFANATRGLGLRSVAEKEAEQAGGEDHALAWVGVGRGRYGNLVISGGEGSDEIYADQVDQIRKKWRAFGSKVQNKGWAEVRID